MLVMQIGTVYTYFVNLFLSLCIKADRIFSQCHLNIKLYKTIAKSSAIKIMPLLNTM